MGQGVGKRGPVRGRAALRRGNWWNHTGKGPGLLDGQLGALRGRRGFSLCVCTPDLASFAGCTPEQPGQGFTAR